MYTYMSVMNLKVILFFVSYLLKETQKCFTLFLRFDSRTIKGDSRRGVEASSRFVEIKMCYKI